MSAFSVERIVELTTEQLGNLRGQLCPVEGCNEYDCQALCDRCGDRHGSMVEIPRSDKARMPRIRTVCQHCQRERECASCEKKLPRYLLVYSGNHDGDGELFCAECSHADPVDAEGW